MDLPEQKFGFRDQVRYGDEHGYYQYEVVDHEWSTEHSEWICILKDFLGVITKLPERVLTLVEPGPTA